MLKEGMIFSWSGEQARPPIDLATVFPANLINQTYGGFPLVEFSADALQITILVTS